MMEKFGSLETMVNMIPGVAAMIDSMTSEETLRV
jgi:signal recognition particle GTPase